LRWGGGSPPFGFPRSPAAWQRARTNAGIIGGRRESRDSWLEISGGCRIITSPSPRGRGRGRDAAVSTSSSFSKDSTVLLAESPGTGRGQGRESGAAGSQQRAGSQVRLKTRDNRDCHLLARFGTPTLARPLPFFIGSTLPPPPPLLTGEIPARSLGSLSLCCFLSLSLSLSLLRLFIFATGHPRSLFPIM